jgi:cyanophycinase-like exopeptidase
MAASRVLAIIGSGETAPTMRSVHADLLAMAGGAEGAAVMLDTPHGFQENADDLAGRSRRYFRDAAGRDVTVASFRSAATATPLEYERMCAQLTRASWVFAGPGSPTYALTQWRETRVPMLLAAKLREGGVVVFASAAAVGLGEVALPVYEIYKAGQDPHWVPGLDLLRGVGLRAAVIPHYNNAEGGTHDTRYCYMGERRLRLLEELLPDGCDVLGVDEHTACIFDLEARTLSVRGRGEVTWRTRGVETRWRHGEVVPLAEVGGARTSRGAPSPPLAAAAPVAGMGDGGGAAPFLAEVRRQRDAALGALAAGDPEAAAGAVLALETAIHDWSGDTFESDEPDQARRMLRELVVQLADASRSADGDPRERLRPLVEAVLAVRETARAEGRFVDADGLRHALGEGGVAVKDEAGGPAWELVETAG